MAVSCPEAGVGAGEMTRRGFLGGGLAVGAAAVVPKWLLRPAPPGRTRDRTVIIGSGVAGLGCAYRLAQEYGIASEVYEYNADRPGGRLYTLRGYFDQGQYAEEHAEFISSEHVETRALAAALGLTLDNVNRYPPGTHGNEYQFRFAGHDWTQSALNREWHEWAHDLFADAAFRKAPWPTLYNRSTPSGEAWDRTPATDWIDKHVPGGLDSNFGRLCVAILLDEYGGPVDGQSALNLVYLLGMYDSAPSQRQPRSQPQLSGTDEKWHIRGGNDQLISGLVERLPAGTVRLGHQLVALAGRGNGRYLCTFATGSGLREVTADEVVLALPFTKLRDVEVTGIDLPAHQIQAIRKQPLGSSSKIQLQFSSRVWNETHWTGNTYNDGVVQGSWETTIDQPGPFGILIALPGGAGGADIGRRYQLPSYYGPAPPAMVHDYLACYENFWPGVSSAFAGKAYYAWSSGDPHIGGAYSYLEVGQYTGFNGIQGRQAGGVHFAGEHTSVNFQGYLEGALRSGYRCAKEIGG
ncbi:MAG TPA: FAD-dependent oxidoreductase [Acidimicrobiales bacterium]|nr:FAD-dependent oxidoreductase [Acidimicrobiales bacterium]